MTENEAIERLEQHKEWGFRCVNESIDIAIQVLEEIQQYRNIGTVEEFKALKEKVEPKKVLFEKQSYGTPYLCPSCGADQCKVEFLAEDGLEVEKKHSYCWICGQVIDWSEEE